MSACCDADRRPVLDEGGTRLAGEGKPSTSCLDAPPCCTDSFHRACTDTRHAGCPWHSAQPRASPLATARARVASARSGRHRIAKPRVHASPRRMREPDVGTNAAAMSPSRLRRSLRTVPRRRDALHSKETNRTLAPLASGWWFPPGVSPEFPANGSAMCCHRYDLVHIGSAHV